MVSMRTFTRTSTESVSFFSNREVLRATETMLAEAMLADLRTRAARVCRCRCAGCTTRKAPLRNMPEYMYMYIYIYIHIYIYIYIYVYSLVYSSMFRSPEVWLYVSQDYQMTEDQGLWHYIWPPSQVQQ